MAKIGHIAHAGHGAQIREALASVTLPSSHLDSFDFGHSTPDVSADAAHTATFGNMHFAGGNGAAQHEIQQILASHPTLDGHLGTHLGGAIGQFHDAHIQPIFGHGDWAI